MMLFTSFSHDETDEQLMERFAFRNSEKAFEELYCRYAPRFKGFFMRMLSADGALALDRSFIAKFDWHLRTECHLAPGTIVNLTVRLKTIVGEAIADGIITAFPFVGYEPTHPQSEQKYLTTEELNRIMTTPLHSRTLYHVRDLFLFSCYTGIPYSDMCMLTNENLSLAEDGIWWIRSSRKKTGVDFEIPLMELPLHIIEKYRDVAPEGKLLPMYSNSSLNHYLKQIAVLCGIERKLVFHVARHKGFPFLLKFNSLQNISA